MKHRPPFFLLFLALCGNSALADHEATHPKPRPIAESTSLTPWVLEGASEKYRALISDINAARKEKKFDAHALASLQKLFEAMPNWNCPQGELENLRSFSEKIFSELNNDEKKAFAEAFQHQAENAKKEAGTQMLKILDVAYRFPHTPSGIDALYELARDALYGGKTGLARVYADSLMEQNENPSPARQVLLALIYKTSGEETLSKKLLAELPEKTQLGGKAQSPQEVKQVFSEMYGKIKIPKEAIGKQLIDLAFSEDTSQRDLYRRSLRMVSSEKIKTYFPSDWIKKDDLQNNNLKPDDSSIAFHPLCALPDPFSAIKSDSPEIAAGVLELAARANHFDQNLFVEGIQAKTESVALASLIGLRRSEWFKKRDPRMIPLLQKVLSHPTNGRVEATARLMRAYGPEMLPVIFGALANPDLSLEQKQLLANNLKEYRYNLEPFAPQIIQLWLNHEDLRYETERALRALGPLAKPALLEAFKEHPNNYFLLLMMELLEKNDGLLAELKKNLKGPESYLILVHIQTNPLIRQKYGKELLPIIQDLAEHSPHSHIKKDAHQILSFLHETDKSVEGPLLAYFSKSPNHALARSLASRQIGAEIVIPYIKTELKNGQIDSDIIDALGLYQDKSKDAVLDLIQAARKADKDSMVAVMHWTIEALAKIPAAAEHSVPYLMDCIRNQPAESGNAIKALGEFGEGAKPALPLLMAMIKDPNADPFAQEIVYSSLGKLARYEPNILNELEQMAEHSTEDSSRRGAIRVLAQNKERAPHLLPLMRKLLKDKTEGVQIAAARALNSLEAPPDELAQIALEFLKSPSIELREEAVFSALDLEGYPEIDIELEKIVKGNENSEDARAYATERLGKHKITTAIPTLIAAMNANGQKLNYKAARALGKMGPKAQAAVPELVKILKDKKRDIFLRGVVAESLGEIGSIDEKTITDLKEMVENRELSPEERIVFVEALSKLKAKNLMALLPSLYSLMNCPEAHERTAAQTAIEITKIELEAPKNLTLRNRLILEIELNTVLEKSHMEYLHTETRELLKKLENLPK